MQTLQAQGRMPGNAFKGQSSTQQALVNGNHVADHADANGNGQYANTSDDEGPPGFANSGRSSSNWSQVP